MEGVEDKSLVLVRDTSSMGMDYAKSQGLELFPFQQGGVELMELIVEERREKNGDGRGGVLLFDDMGLGKTMEVLAYIARMNPRPKKVLIIAPNTLKAVWREAVRTWLPPEHLAVFATGRGGLRRFKGLADNQEWLDAAALGTRIMITNYETMRSKQYMNILIAFSPNVMIFDEAHRLRNWDKKTARASRSISGETEIIVTGTPVVNHAGDLWSLVHRVAPDEAGSATHWDYTYTYQQNGRYGARKSGVKNQVQLRELLSKIAIQRKKEDVLKDLPPKLYHEVPLDMEEGQREAYESMVTDLFVMLDEGLTLQASSVLAQLIRLRQLCCDPKLVGKFGTGSVKTEFVEEYLEDNLGEEQLVIFSNFEQYITILEEKVKAQGLLYARLTGKEDGDKRAASIEEFTKHNLQVMLCTTGAGGEGVNLQSAQKMIMTDKWWSPVKNDQAVDRIHRIGQLGSVEIILPHCVESIDDALNEILKRKYTVINETRIQGDTLDLIRSRRARR